MAIPQTQRPNSRRIRRIPRRQSPPDPRRVESQNPQTEDTIPVLDELQSIAQQAIDRFSRFSNLQVRVANNQPPIPPDFIEIVVREACHLYETLRERQSIYPNYSAKNSSSKTLSTLVLRIG
jgi:hypothetical protein